MNNLRKIAAGSLAAVLAFSMAACGSSNAPPMAPAKAPARPSP